jgi:hypothetical protein
VSSLPTSCLSMLLIYWPYIPIFSLRKPLILLLCVECLPFLCLHRHHHHHHVICHRPFLPCTSPPEPMATPTTQTSSFRLQYLPYYVWLVHHILLFW